MARIFAAMRHRAPIGPSVPYSVSPARRFSASVSVECSTAVPEQRRCVVSDAADLRERFAFLRREDALRTPGFAHVLQRAGRTCAASARLLGSAAVLLTAVVACCGSHTMASRRHALRRRRGLRTGERPRISYSMRRGWSCYARFRKLGNPLSPYPGSCRTSTKSHRRAVPAGSTHVQEYSAALGDLIRIGCHQNLHRNLTPTAYTP
jgi:hypothetical protein